MESIRPVKTVWEQKDLPMEEKIISNGISVWKKNRDKTAL